MGRGKGSATRGVSVLGRLLDAIDDNHLDWRIHRFQLQTKLLLNGGKQAGKLCISRRRRYLQPHPAELRLIRRPVQREVEAARQTSSIDYRPIKNVALHHADEVAHCRVDDAEHPGRPEAQTWQSVR